MNVGEVINQHAIDLDLQVNDKQGALEALVDLLFQDGAITSKEQFIKDVYLREAEGKTGIGNFIAIPHGKSDSVVRACLAIGKVEAGIPWETIDGLPVKLIILFAVDNHSRNHHHVQLLGKLAGTLADEEVCERLLRAKTLQDVLAVFE